MNETRTIGEEIIEIVANTAGVLVPNRKAVVTAIDEHLAGRVIQEEGADAEQPAEPPPAHRCPECGAPASEVETPHSTAIAVWCCARHRTEVNRRTGAWRLRRSMANLAEADGDWQPANEYTKVAKLAQAKPPEPSTVCSVCCEPSSRTCGDCGVKLCCDDDCMVFHDERACSSNIAIGVDAPPGGSQPAMVYANIPYATPNPPKVGDDGFMINQADRKPLAKIIRSQLKLTGEIGGMLFTDAEKLADTLDPPTKSIGQILANEIFCKEMSKEAAADLIDRRTIRNTDIVVPPWVETKGGDE